MKRGVQVGFWIAASLLLAGALPVCGQSKAARDSVKALSTPQTPVTTAPAPHMPSVDGATVDRVVAVVNGDLVLDSDVDEERRLEAFQPYRTSSIYNRDRTIARLINRDLILQQAKLTAIAPITSEDVDREVADLRKNIPACKQYDCTTDAGWKKFLAVNGFTEGEFNRLWEQRMRVLAFIEERFKQGIHISDAEIKTYYESKLLPQFAQSGTTPPKLDDVAGRVRDVLLEQQVSALLQDWLKSLRAQGSVVVLHPGEAAP